MKTFTHNFLDDIVIVNIYMDNGSQVVVVQRDTGEVYNLTEQDIDAADFYLTGRIGEYSHPYNLGWNEPILLDDDNQTVDMTDVEYEDNDEYYPLD